MVTVIGIAGGSASGKSSVARRVASALDAECLLVAHDRYYRPASSPATNFDHPDALDTERLLADLLELRAARPARLPVYDFTRHDRVATEAVAPRPVVVVEGILVLAVPRLRELFDLRVFVDAPADLRLARRLRRDVAERGRTLHSVLAQYEDTVRPMHEAFVEPSRHYADLVLDGTRALDDAAARVLARIGQLRY